MADQGHTHPDAGSSQDAHNHTFQSAVGSGSGLTNGGASFSLGQITTSTAQPAVHIAVGTGYANLVAAQPAITVAAQSAGAITVNATRWRRGAQQHAAVARHQFHHKIPVGCPLSFARSRFLPALSPRRRSSNGRRTGPKTNLMRWIEGQMSPVGGQSQFNFTFASRCKRVHGWFGLNQVYHIAFLCEAHLYVLTGGTLTNISPTPRFIRRRPSALAATAIVFTPIRPTARRVRFRPSRRRTKCRRPTASIISARFSTR